MTTTAQSPAHSRVTVSTPGYSITGTWAGRTGGNRTSDARRYREGGELYREEVGGSPATTEDMTLSRPFKRDRDIELLRWLVRNAGKAMLTITDQPLDEDGNAYGRPLVETARLLGCSRPDADADDTTGIQRLEITVAPSGDLA